MRDDDPAGFWAEFRAPWVQRAVLVLAVLAAILGRAVEPGLRGVAAHTTFEALATVSGITSNALALGLVVVVGAAVNELTRRREIGGGVRWIAFVLGMVTITLMVGASSFKVPKGFFSAPLAVAALAALLTSGIAALRFPPSRGVGIVFLSLSTSVVLRLVAFRLATHDERAIDYFPIARGFGRTAFAFETIAVFAAGLWVFARAPKARIVLAVALGFSLAAGALFSSDVATPVQSMLKALANDVTLYDASLARWSLGLGVLACSLALISLSLSSDMLVLSAALGLALLGRGATDAPLRALVSTAASLWLILSFRDPRGIRMLLRGTPTQTAPTSSN